MRKLTEETGLTARAEDTHVVTLLHDNRLDVRRVTTAIQVTRWDSVLALPEPHRSIRWEFHDLNNLAPLGQIFAPGARTLTAVWPGVLPGLPPVHSYTCSPTAPPAPGSRTRSSGCATDGGHSDQQGPGTLPPPEHKTGTEQAAEP